MTDGRYSNAGMSITMNPTDALDIALMLIRSVEKHGKDTQKSVDVLVRRLAKSVEKNKQIKPGEEK